MLSPTLFNLYIDRLLVTLKNSGLGCHTNGTYMGELSYADDITLSCPSVHGLNKMMNICCDFATNNFITFNAKKTICIKYGESVRPTEHVILDGKVIAWHTGVRHLGNVFWQMLYLIPLTKRMDTCFHIKRYVIILTLIRSKPMIMASSLSILPFHKSNDLEI